MKFFLWVALVVFFSGCNNSEKENTEINGDIVYDMYKPSEMSILMNEMYDYNLKIKQEILEGKTPVNFPTNFLNIYTAELSEFKSRNETFQAYSSLFVENQKEICNTDAHSDISERYNNAINLCISCHKTECTGPIPKIKKLLIN
ncbi:hypothetical protein V8G56_13020 [Gaetbulibacter aquiaggeris]|uniref:Cytochrome c n=1 Tax=Gaetbulibacter aquiaggeris TaxID=1735373 RepID=A0ABW7MVD4_9FLAO